MGKTLTPAMPLFDGKGAHLGEHDRGHVLQHKNSDLREQWRVTSYYWPEHCAVLPPHVSVGVDTGVFSMTMKLHPVEARLLAKALCKAADTVDLVKAELKKQAEAEPCSSK